MQKMYQYKSEFPIKDNVLYINFSSRCDSTKTCTILRAYMRTQIYFYFESSVQKGKNGILHGIAEGRKNLLISFG